MVFHGVGGNDPIPFQAKGISLEVRKYNELLNAYDQCSVTEPGKKDEALGKLIRHICNNPDQVTYFKDSSRILNDNKDVTATCKKLLEIATSRQKVIVEKMDKHGMEKPNKVITNDSDYINEIKELVKYLPRDLLVGLLSGHAQKIVILNIKKSIPAVKSQKKEEAKPITNQVTKTEVTPQGPHSIRAADKAKDKILPPIIEISAEKEAAIEELKDLIDKYLDYDPEDVSIGPKNAFERLHKYFIENKLEDEFRKIFTEKLKEKGNQQVQDKISKNVDKLLFAASHKNEIDALHNLINNYVASNADEVVRERKFEKIYKHVAKNNLEEEFRSDVGTRNKAVRIEMIWKFELLKAQEPSKPKVQKPPNFTPEKESFLTGNIKHKDEIPGADVMREDIPETLSNAEDTSVKTKPYEIFEKEETIHKASNKRNPAWDNIEPSPREIKKPFANADEIRAALDPNLQAKRPSVSEPFDQDYEDLTGEQLESRFIEQRKERVQESLKGFDKLLDKSDIYKSEGKLFKQAKSSREIAANMPELYKKIGKTQTQFAELIMDARRDVILKKGIEDKIAENLKVLYGKNKDAKAQKKAAKIIKILIPE